MTPECVNLAERFGRQYRVTFDPAARTWGERQDPWMMQLPCAGPGVTIYPHGGDRLAAEVNGRPGVARKLAQLPGVTCTQYGGFGGDCTFVFSLALWDAVAEIVKPRRRRVLSEEARAALIERTAATRFRPSPGLQSEIGALAAGGRPRGDS